VNWNLWARTDRLYVKQYKSDTNLNLYILLDTSASMLCRHGPAPKWQYGARAAAALAYLALQARDAAGVFLLGDRIGDYVPPKVKPGQFHEILAVLENAAPGGGTGLRQTLEETLQLCRRRGIVVLISDLFDSGESFFEGLDNLRFYGHEILLVNVLDPWEEHLPEYGQYEFRDLESGETIRANAAAIRRSAHENVTAWQAKIRRRCVDTGIDFLTVKTSDPLRDLLIDYLLKRSGTT
jgi:uncharacterized protein (DUF58 family)